VEVSTSGAGTTFRLFLPTMRAEDPVPDSVGATEVSRDERRSRTILLVESDPATRSVAERVLTERGYCVLEAEDGVAALTLVDAYQGSLDLLVTALDVPDLDADALAARVLAFHPGARVLYLGDGPDDRPEGPSLPADAGPGVLVETVEALLADSTDDS
jgi:CheY-like chemotaxis protein